MNNKTPELLPPNIKIQISGPHILLRPISSVEIGSKYIGWLNDPAINQYLEVRLGKQTQKSAVEYINSLRAQAGNEMFAILTKKDQRHIGNMTVTEYVPKCKTSYGLMLGEQSAWQLGIGAECTALLLELLFEHIGIHRVYGGAYANNLRATDILERFGYVLEACLRDHIINPDGNFDDLKIFGMLKSEWPKNRRLVRGILKRSKFEWQ